MTDFKKNEQRIIIGCLGDSLTDGHPGYSCYYERMGTNANDPNLRPEFDYGDGLHFSVAGYKKMGDLIYEVCRQKVMELT